MHELGTISCIVTCSLFIFSPDDRGSNHRLIEREANRFAAELLMPASEVRELAPTMCFLSLAAHFGVSRQAMHLRLLEMNM